MLAQGLDNALDDPAQLRAAALELNYRSYDFGHCVFHGIAVGEPTRGLIDLFREIFPRLSSTVSFFRKSPVGQVEPHFIHSDVDMGEWSAILYLNENPPAEDGTCFWTHRSTGAIGSSVPHERSEEGKDAGNWDLRMRVNSRFNRLLVFPSWYFHSRSIGENWGQGRDARLIQVVFGTGELTPYRGGNS